MTPSVVPNQLGSNHSSPLSRNLGPSFRLASADPFASPLNNLTIFILLLPKWSFLPYSAAFHSQLQPPASTKNSAANLTIHQPSLPPCPRRWKRLPKASWRARPKAETWEVRRARARAWGLTPWERPCGAVVDGGICMVRILWLSDISMLKLVNQG